jgi:integrating conjugative element membrane protein (TIGR03747 family)
LASRNASFHERGIAGALLAPLKFFFGASLLLLGLLLAAWIIDWLFVFYVWPEGVARLQGILAEDLARAVGYSTGEPPHLAEKTANFLYALLFEATGIHGMGARFAEASALSIPDTVVRNAYVANFKVIQVAMIGTQLFGVRLAMLMMATPLLALVYCAAVADGLAQRAIRRASGGRESASLYHRAKHLQVVLLVTGAAVVLLWPASIDPRYLWISGAVVLGVFARLQWTFYKKHL